MSLSIVAIVLVVTLFALLALGLEIGASIGLVAIIGILLFTSQPLFSLAGQVWTVSNSFVLTALPLFILMGELFSEIGIAKKLFWAVDQWLGSLPGGVSSTVIGASAVFAAITGSSVAGAAVMGTIAIEPMREQRYDIRLIIGVIAAGGCLGILIPPSIIMIVYGAFQGLSVGRLFAAGVIPGVLLASAFLLTIFVIVKIRPGWFPKPERHSWKEKVIALRELIPSAIIIFIVLGGVFGGVMTPTEAAAVGCVSVFLLGIAYRRMSKTALKVSIIGAVKTTAMVMLVIVAAKALAFVMQFLGLGEAFKAGILSSGLGKYGTLALIVGMYFVLGMFFEGISMMVLTLPFIMPIISGLGLSEYWFVVPLVIMVEAALLTPPVGLNLFVLNSFVPEYDVLQIAKSCLPFYAPLLLVIILVTVYPQLVLWFPNLIYG